MPHICRVPGPDRPKLNNRLSRGNFSLTFVCLRFHPLLALRVCAKTLSACSRDTRQTSSTGRYGGLIFFFLFSDCHNHWGLFLFVDYIFFMVEKGGARCSWWCCAGCSLKKWWQENILDVFFFFCCLDGVCVTDFGRVANVFSRCRGSRGRGCRGLFTQQQIFFDQDIALKTGKECKDICAFLFWGFRRLRPRCVALPSVEECEERSNRWFDRTGSSFFFSYLGRECFNNTVCRGATNLGWMLVHYEDRHISCFNFLQFFEVH